MSLHNAIPAFPARDVAATSSCRIKVDDVDGLFAVTDLDGNLIVFFRRV